MKRASPIGVFRRLAVLACVAALGAPPLLAQVRGLSYTVSPVVERLYFDGNAALDDATLYGGQLGLGFGRFVELEGLYLVSDGVSNDFSDVGGIADQTRQKLEALDGREIALRRYGGRIKINAPSANVLPYVTLGGGVLSFEPEHLNETRTIYLSLGGGLQFSVAGRYAVSFGAERFAYRYNLGATFFDDLDLARADLSDQSFNHVQVNNWALRAGIRIYAGGRAPGEETALDEALRRQFSGGLRGLSLHLEPFAGQLNFDEELGFKTEQRMAGLFAGLNLGPFIGVRGFYWRGVESGLFEFDRLQAYGGELRFELTTGQSLSPYLIVGGGYLDVLSGYRGSPPAGEDVASVLPSTPEDEPFIIAGGGAVLPLNESLSLSAGARSVLLTREGVDNVNAPSDVVSSWMFSAGLTFGFGARGDGAGEAIRSEIAGTAAARDREEAEVRRELADAEARIDSLARLIQRIGEGDVEAIQEAQAAPVPPRDTLAARRAAPRQDRMVTLPLPEQGELYIRFGEPGGVSIESFVGDAGSVDVANLPAERQALAAERQALTAERQTLTAERQTLTAEQIEQIVSQTVREQLRAQEAAGADEADLDRIERQIQNRLDALEDRLQARLDRRLSELDISEQPYRVIVEDEDGTMREVRIEPDIRRRGARAVYPFTAFMGGQPNLWIVGLRFDPGAPFLGPIELQPEIAFGFGAETYAYHVNLDAVYTAGFFERVVSGLRPYAGLGAGMLGFDERPEDAPGVQLTFNMRIGSEFALPWGHFFLEYGTFDLFEYDRVAAGYRVRF